MGAAGSANLGKKLELDSEGKGKLGWIKALDNLHQTLQDFSKYRYNPSQNCATPVANQPSNPCHSECGPQSISTSSTQELVGEAET